MNIQSAFSGSNSDAATTLPGEKRARIVFIGYDYK
jgi:hypothetical protein